MGGGRGPRLGRLVNHIVKCCIKRAKKFIG